MSQELESAEGQVAELLASLGYKAQAMDVRGLLRVRLMREDKGDVSVEDCTRATHALQRGFPNRRVEVTSGPLTSQKGGGKEAWVGGIVKISTRRLIAGQRKFQGILLSLEEGQAIVQTKAESRVIPEEDISEFTLVTPKKSS